MMSSSTEPEPESSRTERLRAELVATVNAAPYAKRSKRPRTIIAAIAAFALAGAATGGTITSTALAAPDEPVTVNVRDIVADFTLRHINLIDTPFVVSSHGRTIIELGKAPEGATSIALNLDCIEPGVFTVGFNSRNVTAMECDSGGAGNNSYLLEVDSPNDQTLTVDTKPSTQYTVWASWANEDAIPEKSSAQAAELADGRVTQDEYNAAFDRYDSCMAKTGMALIGIDRSGTVIKYSTVSEAVYSAARQCYEVEFKDVDVEWQIANQDSP